MCTYLNGTNSSNSTTSYGLLWDAKLVWETPPPMASYDLLWTSIKSTIYFVSCFKNSTSYGLLWTPMKSSLYFCKLLQNLHLPWTLMDSHGLLWTTPKTIPPQLLYVTLQTQPPMDSHGLLWTPMGATTLPRLS